MYYTAYCTCTVSVHCTLHFCTLHTASSCTMLHTALCLLHTEHCIQHYTAHCTMLHTAPYCIILYIAYYAMHCIVLTFTSLHWNIPYCTAMWTTISQFSALHSCNGYSESSTLQYLAAPIWLFCPPMFCTAVRCGFPFDYFAVQCFALCPN